MRARRRGEGNSCRHCRRPHRRYEQGNLKVAWTLRNNIGRKLVLDTPDLVTQDQFALLQPLYLDKVRAGGSNKSRNGRVEIAVFLQQARQLLPQRAFFLVSHCHRCLGLAGPSRQERGNYCVFHKRVQAWGKSTPIKGLRRFAAEGRRV